MTQRKKIKQRAMGKVFASDLLPADFLPDDVVWETDADSPSNNVSVKSSPHPRAAVPIRNKVKDIIHRHVGVNPQK